MGINRRLSSLLIAGIGVLVCVVFCVGSIRTNDKSVIPENVCIGGVDVSGMTAEEAAFACQNMLDKAAYTAVVFYCDTGMLEYRLSDIGYETNLEESIDYVMKHGGGVSLAVKVYPADNTESVLEYLLREFNVGAHSATIVFEGEKLVIEPGTAGIKVDIERTSAAFAAALKGFKAGERIEVEVSLDCVDPEINAWDLRYIEDVLGCFETDYSSAAGRMANVENAVRLIDGTILMPGEEFDIGRVIGPITVENGYSHAAEFYAGRVVQGVGGGVCQASTTLYNAVLYAELEITERFNHSMAVSYVSLARDAAIAENVKNFRFVNSTGTPIYIRGTCHNGMVSFAIYGCDERPVDRKIEFETVLIRTIAPGETVEILDESLPPGAREVAQNARSGYVAELWKHIYAGEVLQDSIKINTSSYMAAPQYVYVGP